MSRISAATFITTKTGIITDGTESSTIVHAEPQSDNTPKKNKEESEDKPTVPVKTTKVTKSSGRAPNVPYTAKDFLKPTVTQKGSVVTEDLEDFDHFKNYIKEKFCYNMAPLEKATVLTKEKRTAYQVDIWTLMEKRTITWRTRAYRQEETPGKDVDDVFSWDDAHWSTPSTSFDGKASRSYDLEESNTKIVCSKCLGDGQAQCSGCHGAGRVVRHGLATTCSKCGGARTVPCSQCEKTGYLLRWAVMNFEWSGLHSTGVYQNSFLPETIVRRVKEKPIFYEHDTDWKNDPFLLDYGTLLKHIQEKAAFDFVPLLHSQYEQKHFGKLKQSVLIRKMKILIRNLDVTHVDYKLEGYSNSSANNTGTDTFTYVIYDKDEYGLPKIYENDYPMNCCGCCGPTVACHSDCSIC